MNTKLLMTASAITLGITGITLSFFPQEVASIFGTSSPIFIQLLGALYFGFAMINWTAKANLIGGIYGRPIAIGNMAHFVIGGLALARFSIDHLDQYPFHFLTVLYLLFGSVFSYIFFTHPFKSTV
ncbi:hypothetical protein V6R21_13645 [Limibacter armeniacum]|uniref:hypothetical protein n=1 Tax=Limibacter armeniacum TaxID=466084 RepID=UPI002FE59C61